MDMRSAIELYYIKAQLLSGLTIVTIVWIAAELINRHYKKKK